MDKILQEKIGNQNQSSSIEGYFVLRHYYVIFKTIRNKLFGINLYIKCFHKNFDKFNLSFKLLILHPPSFV